MLKVKCGWPTYFFSYVCEKHKTMEKVALVLSGGGARGIAHIGVIEELQSRGYEITSVAGTSMGALVGGVFALGKLEEFREWLYSLDKLKVFSLVDFTLSTQGLVKGDKVLNAMKEFIADAQIEDLEIPYTATATDLINKKEVVLGSGSVFEAIRASIAIPTVFTPVQTEKGLLVDGGVVNNIPIANVKRTPGDSLVVVDVNANVEVLKPKLPEKVEEEHRSRYLQKLKDFHEHLIKISPLGKQETMGYFDLMNKTIGLMMYRISQLSLEQYHPDLLVNISKETCGTFDFFKAEELVNIGRQTAIKALDEKMG